MTISLSRYVSINSGVGGAATFGMRDLGGRIITTNPLCPVGAVLTFYTADTVIKHFGSTSAEAKIATRYFGFVSKTAVKPRKISFTRWAEAAVEAMVFGATVSDDVSVYQAIINGNFTITLGDKTAAITGLDFSAATTMANVATTLQSEIVKTITGVTVSFVQGDNPHFVITAPASVTEGEFVVGDDGAEAFMGLATSAGAISAPATAAQEPVDAAIAGVNVSDDFGSFTFCGTALSESQEVAVSAWNHAQNVKYMFCTTFTTRARAKALKGYSGTAIMFGNTTGTAEDRKMELYYSALMPMCILAATDWTRRAASGNFMYYRFDSGIAIIASDVLADTMDMDRVNYLGQVQRSGQKVAFFQRGVLMGDNTAPTDMTTYAGEMWLKDKFLADIMNMFLAQPSVPAAEEGRVMVLGVMQDGIAMALDNGVISVGKTLTANQRAYVTALTGDEMAWMTIQTKGYYIDADIVDYVNENTGLTEYKCVYTLLYSKNDQIRFVQGYDILI